MSKTLVIGAAFVDVLMDVPKLPTTGEDISGHLRANIVGGSAFNVYGAIKYAGQDADLFVPVGEGQYADLVSEDMAKMGIRPLLKVNGADNGWDISFVEPDGERSFLTVNGIEQLWQPDWFENIDISNYDFFYISGYEMEDDKVAGVILDALDKRNSDSQVLFDASPRIEYISQKTLQRLYDNHVMIHCNEDETRYLFPGVSSLEMKCQEIFVKTHAPIVLTLGEEGAYLYAGKHHSEMVRSAKVKVVNTLGAGDTFCGGFLAGLSQNMSLSEAVQQGNELAALVVGQDSGTLLNKQ